MAYRSPRIDMEASDPRIWSKLPTDELTIVMDHAETSKARKKWLVATMGNYLLYCHALKVYYSHFVISRENILRITDQNMGRQQHGKDETEILRAVHRQRVRRSFKREPPLQPLLPPAAFVRGLLARYIARRRVKIEHRVGPLPIAATFVRSLLLNCQYGYKDGFTWRDTEADLWDNTLSTLRPHLQSLTKLEQYGSLQERIWIHILEWHSLVSLSIRQSNTLSDDAITLGKHHRIPVALTGWENLIRLKSLQHLNVDQLLTNEAAGLAHAVTHLSNLETLRIKAASLKAKVTHNLQYGFTGANVDTPIARFFRNLFSTPQKPQEFLTILKRLAIIDDNRLTLRAENTFLQEGETQPLPHLTHLYIDCPDDFFAFRLIYKLRPASLIDLSVSALSKEPDPIHVYAFETVLPKLHNLTILNISRNVGFIQKFFAPDRRLQHYKHGLQLYRTPLTQKPPPNYPPRIWPPIYLLTEIIFGKLIESIPKSLVHPFGDQVRHICISNKGMGSIQVDGIDDPVYALTNLRVLIIRPPVVVGRGYWDPTLEIKPYPQGRLSLPLPHPTESYPAVKGDAMFLARQQLLSLRFVVLHNQYFWIEHLDGQRHKTQVWELEDALEDVTQKEKMKALVTEADWAFLRDESGAVGKFANAEELRRGNRLVMHNDVAGFQDVQQQGYERKRKREELEDGRSEKKQAV